MRKDINSNNDKCEAIFVRTHRIVTSSDMSVEEEDCIIVMCIYSALVGFEMGGSMRILRNRGIVV
jgi:hypothetical protein